MPGAQIVVVDMDDPGKVDVLVPMSGNVDAVLMERACPRLIQQFGVGLQGVDVDAARKRRIPVACLPGGDTGNAAAVAEIAVLHLLVLLRRFAATQRSISQRLLGQPIGTTLVGKTVTVLGVGAIGTEVAARLGSFGAEVLGVGRSAHHDQPSRVRSLAADRYFLSGDLLEPLAQSLALVVCCPLTEETRGMVGAPELAAMPPGGYLINVSRGPVVERAALLSALRRGHLAGAGLDVTWEEPVDPDDELLAENVSITPHVGGVTHESYAAMAGAFAANVARLDGDEPLRGLVS